jgi:hypothetical protein
MTIKLYSPLYKYIPMGMNKVWLSWVCTFIGMNKVWLSWVCTFIGMNKVWLSWVCTFIGMNKVWLSWVCTFIGMLCSLLKTLLLLWNGLFIHNFNLCLRWLWMCCFYFNLYKIGVSQIHLHRNPCFTDLWQSKFGRNFDYHGYVLL